MLQGSVNVKYVNPPKGKGPASVKDDQGNYWKFWTNKIPLDKFEPGKTYSVGYETEDYQGKEQRTILAVSMPQDSGPKTGNGHTETTRMTNDRDAFRIFCCGLVQAGINGGEVKFNVTDLVTAFNTAKETWQQTFGKQA